MTGSNRMLLLIITVYGTWMPAEAFHVVRNWKYTFHQLHNNKKWIVYKYMALLLHVSATFREVVNEIKSNRGQLLYRCADVKHLPVDRHCRPKRVGMSFIYKLLSFCCCAIVLINIVNLFTARNMDAVKCGSLVELKPGSFQIKFSCIRD